MKPGTPGNTWTGTYPAWLDNVATSDVDRWGLSPTP